MRMRPVALISATAFTALTATLAPATAAHAAPSHKPDTGCMHAGVKTLQSAMLLDDVARGGLPISTALALGVTPRAGADLTGVPDPLPLSLILADHRAGSRSVFVYPWCN